jgi:membrane protein implicated in regulation of membrane protease activity
MTTAQIVFSIALGSIAVGILLFGAYVVSSTMWGNRWIRRPERPRAGSVSER